MDYTELVKSLREFGDIWRDQLLYDAADAIEELQKDAEREKAFAECWEKLAHDCRARFQKLVDAIKESKCPHYIRNVHDRGDDSLCTNFNCEISALPRWISVEERLPEEELNFYLCYTDEGIVVECLWTNNKYGLGPFGNWGWRIMDVPQYQRITHWMPLPEPPKEET